MHVLELFPDKIQNTTLQVVNFGPLITYFQSIRLESEGSLPRNKAWRAQIQLNTLDSTKSRNLNASGGGINKVQGYNHVIYSAGCSGIPGKNFNANKSIGGTDTFRRREMIYQEQSNINTCFGVMQTFVPNPN